MSSVSPIPMRISHFYRLWRAFLARLFCCFVLSLACSSCCLSGRTPSVCVKQAAHQQPAADHPLYKKIPRYREEIRWYQIGKWTTWALFGNEDDGIFGEEPTAGQWTKEPIGFKRACLWTARNPLHNFNFYVIGSAHQENSELTLLSLAKGKTECFRYRKKAETVFPSKGTCFYLGFHGWKPFLSLRIDYGRIFETYIGWRERGNFGFKFCPARKKHKDTN